MYSPLNRLFFNSLATEVARDLLGKILVVGNKSVEILETEAYRGSDDPASHAYKGITKRSSIMFGVSGFSYVYLIYGMYHCLNVVTEEKDMPSAVLIRGGRLLTPPYTLLNGPGKFCRDLSITKEQHAVDMTDKNSPLYFSQGRTIKNIETTPRIGIRQGADKLWRFVAQE